MFRVSVVAVVLFVALTSSFRIQPRVINGDLSDYTQFPFFVALQSDTGQCGATLISNSWILTAAHCLKNSSNIRAYLGIRSKGEFSRKIIIPISNQHAYPEYNGSANANDIALLELPEPTTFNRYIRPAVFTSVFEVPHKGGESVIVAGRGRTEMDKKPFDSRLRQAHFVTMPSDHCSEQMVQRPRPHTIICANANYDTNQTMYFGDSGGPILRRDTGHLLGLASAVKHIGKRGNPVRFQVFTNVPFYYSWIEWRTGLKLPPRYCLQAFGHRW